MNRINPLHIGVLLLVVLIFFIFKLNSAKSLLAEAKESYSQTMALSSRLSGLKEVYDDKEKMKKALNRILEQPSLKSLKQEMKKTGLAISSQMMDADALNALMSKLLNGSYNITALNIKKLARQMSAFIWRFHGKKTPKALGLLSLFLLALIYFAPKVSIYYFLETLLSPHAIAISSEKALDTGFTLKINHANISVKTIESANISEIDMKIFALYNTIECRDITLSSAAQSFIPLHVETATLKYTVLDPFYVNVKIDGEFGEANVKFNILKKALHLNVTPSELMLKEYKSTLLNMSKNEKGEYVYDKTI